MIFIVIFILALAFWIYAERKLGLSVRVWAGLACMAFLGLACTFVANVIPSYERSFHTRSIQLSGELIARGETLRVQQAIGTYTNLAATGTTYGAAMRMWEVLNHGAGSPRWHKPEP